MIFLKLLLGTTFLLNTASYAQDEGGQVILDHLSEDNKKAYERVLEGDPIKVEALIEFSRRYNLSNDDLSKMSLNMGDMDSGGGDRIGQEFFTRAHSIQRYIESSDVLFLNELQKEKVKQVINDMKVITLERVFRGDIPVDAVNIPKINTIFIGRERWDEKRNDLVEVERFVLHEILGLAGIEDSQYQVSMLYQNENRISNPRLYRIMKAEGTYGYAFGVKNKKVDFEYLDESDERIWDFIETNEDDLCYYVVNLRTMDLISSDCTGFRGLPSGGRHFGNHFTNNMKVLTANRYGMDLVATFSYAKWWGGVDKLYLIKSGDKEDKKLLATCDYECFMKQLEQKVFTQLEKDTLKRIEEMACTGYMSIDNYENIYKHSCEIPKQDEGITLKVKFNVSLESKNIIIDFGIPSVEEM